MSNTNKKFNYEKARQFLLNKEKKKREQYDALLRKALKEFEGIITLLKTHKNIKRIYQWGSLINKEHFSDISDIDIAVEGDISAEEFFKIFGEADNLTTFPLDLVDIEKIDPLHADSIKKYGRIVYERE